MNTATFRGNLGADASLRYLDNGSPVVKFSLAVKMGAQPEERTLWIDCSWFVDSDPGAFGLVKGAYVTVQGQVDVRAFADKQDGKARAVLMCKVESGVVWPPLEEREPPRPPPQTQERPWVAGNARGQSQRPPTQSRQPGYGRQGGSAP